MPDIPDGATLDLVFNHFCSPDVLRALNAIDGEKVYTHSDLEKYSPVLLSQVWGIYAQGNWN